MWGVLNELAYLLTLFLMIYPIATAVVPCSFIEKRLNITSSPSIKKYIYSPLHRTIYLLHLITDEMY